jgi:hypothetical protein
MGRGNWLMFLVGGYVVYCLLPKSVLPISFQNGTRVTIGQTGLKSQSLKERHQVTLSEFNQLQVGMHSTDVVKLLGRPVQTFMPKPHAPENMVGVTLYTWKNVDGSLCRVDFKDGLLTDKRQVRLQD